MTIQKTLVYGNLENTGIWQSRKHWNMTIQKTLAYGNLENIENLVVGQIYVDYIQDHTFIFNRKREKNLIRFVTLENLWQNSM